MSNVQQTLDERGARYGDFTDHAEIAQDLQDVMRGAEGWENANAVQRQALTVIADKIARILSGDPNYADNWHDIQGYARLVEERLVEPGAPMIDPHGALAEAVNPSTGHPPWPCDERYRWMAQDANGKWFASHQKPQHAEEFWFLVSTSSSKSIDLRQDTPNPNWRDTLMERPSC